MLTNLNVALSPAKVQDLHQQRIIALLKLPDEAHSPGLRADFNHSVSRGQLVETDFFARILLENNPILK
jgi:hypothetical protein